MLCLHLRNNGSCAGMWLTARLRRAVLCCAVLCCIVAGWRISHRTHHGNHGHVENDESWYPFTESQYKTAVRNTRQQYAAVSSAASCVSCPAVPP
jgi:hypothetical protein